MTTVGVEVAASITAVVQTWMYGNKSLWGPSLGICGVLLFIIIMVVHGLWGLAPLNLFALVVHSRNLLKWRAESPPHHKRGRGTGVQSRKAKGLRAFRWRAF